MKPSIYTIAVRAKTCELCTFLNLTVAGIKDKNRDNYQKDIQDDSISLKDQDAGLKWINSNSTYYLNKGTYDIKIYSDLQTDLDSILVYENTNAKSAPWTNRSEQLNELFNVSSPAAKLSGLEKINPTKYVLNIENATRPYIVSLAEAYDPLWVAYKSTDDGQDNNYKINSSPLYGVVNGFQVNMTGNYRLILEYQPQNWFMQGATVSIFALTLILVVSLFHFKRVMRQKQVAH